MATYGKLILRDLEKTLCVTLFQRNQDQKTKRSSNRKEDINVYYNQTEGGVGSHDQKCFLFTTARKPNPWPMRVFTEFSLIPL